MEEARRNASSFNTSQCSTETKRQLDFLLRNKELANRTIAKMVEDLKTDMENTYSGATILRDPRYVRNIGEGTQLQLGQIMKIMSESRDPTERRYLWLSWRKVIKEKLRGKYINYVRLNNIGAVENGFPDAGNGFLLLFHFLFPALRCQAKMDIGVRKSGQNACLDFTLFLLPGNSFFPF